MEFHDLIERALQIRALYGDLEQQRYGRAWTNEEIALGFMGDGNLRLHGDLAKLVIAQNGVRDIPDARQKLAHELSDCLWSIIVLAHNYDLDLEASFLETMNSLEQQIKAELRE